MKKISTKKLLAIFILIIVLAILLFYLFANNSSKSDIIERGKVSRGEITSFVEETGIVQSQVGAMIKVGTRASGILEKLPYQIGDYVKKGDLIAQIDDREVAANLNSARATLDRLESELKLLENTYPLQISEIEARIRASKATYDYTMINLEREKTLLEKDFTTQDSVDRAKREVDVAHAEYQVATKTMARFKEEYVQKRISIRASITAQNEQVKAYKIAISYTKIYAPISGYVSQVATQEGETVVAQLNAPNLISLIDPSKLEIHLYVDETDVGLIGKGSRVMYYVGASPDRWFNGEIFTIWPQPAVSGNIVYYISVVKVSPEDALLIRPNMTVHARIITQKKSDVLIIPSAALKFVDGKTVVYKVNKEKLTPVSVQIGLKGENEIEILKGVKEGDEVAVKFVLQKKKKWSLR